MATAEPPGFCGKARGGRRPASQQTGPGRLPLGAPSRARRPGPGCAGAPEPPFRRSQPTPTADMPPSFPFTAVVGQEALKRALLLCVIQPGLGGVLVRGTKGVAKSTAV